MVRRLHSLTLTGAIGVALLCALVVEQEKILLQAELILQSSRNSLLIEAVGLYLTAFMALLLLRYVLLIICSYLEHLRHPTILRQTQNALEDSALPYVTIVVPAFNEGPVIRQALQSLLELDYPNYEVLVIDDGSTDDTYERLVEISLASTRIPVRVISKENGGKADALNTGLAYARGDFIFNMDGDTKLSPDCLRMCIRHFGDPRIGAVAGNVKVHNRENALTRLQALEYIQGLAMVRKAQSFFRIVSIIPGPAGMFRKSALAQVHGYDSDTFAEDCDTTIKLLMAGWHINYEPSTVAWVETPSRMLDLIKQRYRWTRGILQAARKHGVTLLRPHKEGVNSSILWNMIFESLLWPASNVAGHLFFIYVSLQHGLAVYLFYWWLQFTLLDIAAAAYCITLENEDMRLLSYAPLFRICYVLALDLTRMFAAFEEMCGFHMTWGKLEREGKL